MNQKIEDSKVIEIKTITESDSVSLIALRDDDSIYISQHHLLDHGNTKHSWRRISESFPKDKNVIQWEFSPDGYGSRLWLLFILCDDGSVWRRGRNKPWIEIKNYP